MKRTKQILAWIAIIVLLALYLCAFVFSFMKSELGGTLFRAAIGCTIILPVFLYMVYMVARVLRPAKSAMIDAIIFDMGKVLMDYPWEERAEQTDYPEDLKRFIQETIDPSPLWYELDLGIRSEEEIIREFCAMNPKYEPEIREFVKTTPECISKFWYTEDLIRSLKRKGYKVYFLSNWCREHYDYLTKNGTFSFLKLFDGGVWSFEVHDRKPNEEIYKMLGKKNRLDPERCVFIDDSEENIEAARKLGFAAIRFHDYNDMIERLNSVGVYF